MAGRAALAAAFVVFALVGCGGSGSGPGSAAAGEIVDLTGLEQLRSAFTEDDGTARLLLVLSPT
jgi:hypothetical protein